ncbi:uncharacterized protein C10orf95-like [Gallus gallus]|uniref:uncharacterized protein C10orf95-like n=1 Tax=Gallus gallus TaxID=9031 RepID=UPI000D63F71A|nr:uncharacterized protein C10orf95-like [Gallus gallus]|eukprot:XP_025008939.1 uncharacterized protein C10orf95-like [Gallus gallus]
MEVEARRRAPRGGGVGRAGCGHCGSAGGAAPRDGRGSGLPCAGGRRHDGGRHARGLHRRPRRTPPQKRGCCRPGSAAPGSALAGDAGCRRGAARGREKGLDAARPCDRRSPDGGRLRARSAPFGPDVRPRPRSGAAPPPVRPHARWGKARDPQWRRFRSGRAPPDSAGEGNPVLSYALLRAPCGATAGGRSHRSRSLRWTEPSGG